ncbi:MAG: (2Fe-2S)-binding protein [Myxococcota bacterium]|nr:(2Fe-2S)-binding protein [Myxococcota bacterium]
MAPSERAPGGPPRLVCRCIGVSSLRIVEACSALGGVADRDLATVQRETGAGSACETCHPEVLEILADLNDTPFAAGLRTENEYRCQNETERRIEAALKSRILPTLPPGSAAELVRVRGLEVWIAFEGPEGERPVLSERLRKLVCRDLDVRFR